MGQYSATVLLCYKTPAQRRVLGRTRPSGRTPRRRPAASGWGAARTCPAAAVAEGTPAAHPSLIRTTPMIVTQSTPLHTAMQPSCKLEWLQSLRRQMLSQAAFQSCRLARTADAAGTPKHRRTFKSSHTERVQYLVLLRRRLAVRLLRVAALAVGPLLLLPALLRRVALVVPLRRPARVACTRAGDSG